VKGKITKNATVELEFSGVGLKKPAVAVACDFMNENFPNLPFYFLTIRQRPMDRVYFAEFALAEVRG